MRLLFKLQGSLRLTLMNSLQRFGLSMVVAEGSSARRCLYRSGSLRHLDLRRGEARAPHTTLDPRLARSQFRRGKAAVVEDGLVGSVVEALDTGDAWAVTDVHPSLNKYSRQAEFEYRAFSQQTEIGI